MLILRILLFVAIAGSLGTIFYFRILALKESQKLMKHFEALSAKLKLPLQAGEKKGNEAFPRIIGTYENRELLIERTLKDKFKYFVVSVSFRNQGDFMFQFTPKDHLSKKEDMDALNAITIDDASLNKNYFMVSSQPDKAQKIVSELIKPFLEKHQQIVFLFSTLIIFNDRITLVLSSGTKKLKNDLLLDVMTHWIYQFAEALEKENI